MLGVMVMLLLLLLRLLDCCFHCRWSLGGGTDVVQEVSELGGVLPIQ